MLWVTVPIGSIVVPFCGLYLGSYKVIAKRIYYGAYGYRISLRVQVEGLGLLGAYAGLMPFRVQVLRTRFKVFRVQVLRGIGFLGGAKKPQMRTTWTVRALSINVVETTQRKRGTKF